MDVVRLTGHPPVLARVGGGYFVERTLVRDDEGYLEWFNGQQSADLMLRVELVR